MNPLKRLLSPSSPQPTDPYDLDIPLIYASQDDAWAIRDACEGVQVFGAIGSGKTSGSGAALARSFLANGFGGLVMCAKPEERRLWEKYATEAGVSDRLVIIEPGGPYRFNFLDYELRRAGRGGGQTENLVDLFAQITELIEGKPQMVSGDDFWERSVDQLLRNAIDLLSLSQGTVSLNDIYKLIKSAPESAKQIGTHKWQQSSFCAACIAEAGKKEKSPREAQDFDMAVEYWLQTHATLDNRTRSNINVTFTSIADKLLHGTAWELCCTDTTIVPEVTYKDGAIIVLDLPIQEHKKTGGMVQGIFKYMFQQAILGRDADRERRPVFLWADEAQNFISSFDYEYQSVARSARACTVYLTQNISNYYAALGGQGRDQANALLGNFSTKIFHANSDQPTNRYASDIIGQEEVWVPSGGTTMGERGHSMNAGYTKTIRDKVMSAEFTTLRKGGPANNLEVDAILFQGGRIWQASGDTYLRTIFKQG